MSDVVCNACGGYGIVRIFYRKIDWYQTRSKNDGKFYYMDAWYDKPCPECQPRWSWEKRTIIQTGGSK